MERQFGSGKKQPITDIEESMYPCLDYILVNVIMPLIYL